MDSTQDNLWNFLFFTGYLKKISERQEGETIYMEMAIPNSEVRYVYKNAVLRWFEEKTAKKELTPLYESMLKGDTEKMAEILSENLMETISFYDYQESYYHGFLVGDAEEHRKLYRPVQPGVGKRQAGYPGAVSQRAWKGDHYRD